MFNYNKNQNLLLSVVVLAGAFLISGVIIFDGRIFKDDEKIEAELISPTPTSIVTQLSVSTIPQTKPKPQQKLSVPVPVETPSGPSVILYAKNDINIYKEISDNSEIVGKVVQYSSWEFPYTPVGDWYSVLTLESKPGYVRATDLIAEKPKSPERCSVVYKYDIGNINKFWIDKGFTREVLLELISYAEKQWEDALGKNIIDHEADSNNKIDFIVDDFFKINPEGNEYGRWDGKNYDNGTPAADFSIIMFSQIFEFSSRPSLLYYGEVVSQHELDKTTITTTITHELGHVIGLGHLDPEKVKHKESIMISKGGYGTSYMPKLTSDDLKLLNEFCGTN